MFLPVLEGSARTVIARNTGVRSSQVLSHLFRVFPL